jgi:copper homeostasis protein
MLVEICVEGVADALAAAEGGADRVELCSHLAVGGITPGPGSIAAARRRLAIPVHVLVRPRGGEFVFSPIEREAMLEDVAFCRATGVAGVVVGALTERGEVDVPTTRALVEAARPMSLTFHRAFDVAADPMRALQQLIDLGVDRVLTSGRGRPARDDLLLLGRLVERAAGRITVLAGGGVTAEDLPALASIGITEAHAGSAACAGGRTSAEKVRALVVRARGLMANRATT